MRCVNKRRPRTAASSPPDAGEYMAGGMICFGAAQETMSRSLTRGAVEMASSSRSEIKQQISFPDQQYRRHHASAKRKPAGDDSIRPIGWQALAGRIWLLGRSPWLRAARASGSTEMAKLRMAPSTASAGALKLSMGRRRSHMTPRAISTPCATRLARGSSH